jgi:hypothetical protein|tara:strand:- start:598 stop:825 length:228 start_codon:yes stop_codon:yes gene_type:complete
MRLLHLDHEGVSKLIEGMEKECIEIKRSSLSLSWYMRGGVSYEDVLNMSIEERKLINEIIEENLETTKKTQLPFF